MALSGHATQFSIYSTIIAFSILSALAVILRLITRLLIVRQSGWDDVFIVIACVSSRYLLPIPQANIANSAA